MDLRPLVLVLPLGLLAACPSTTEKQHPPLADCTQATCPENGPTAGGVQGGGKPMSFGMGGSAGAGAGAGAAGASAGGSGSATTGLTVTGTVVDILTEDFQKTVPYTMSVLVSASSPNPSVPMTTTTYDGQIFHVPNVMPGSTWLRTQPLALDVLGTWLLVLVDGKSQVTLPVVQREVLNAILAALPTPQQINDELAQLVVMLVDGQGAAVAGATVMADVPATVGYDDGPGYTGTTTHTRGIVVLLNAGASKGATLVVTTKDGKAVSVPNLPLDKRTVTLAKVTLP